MSIVQPVMAGSNPFEFAMQVFDFQREQSISMDDDCIHFGQESPLIQVDIGKDQIVIRQFVL
jgi:hypothetical protein